MSSRELIDLHLLPKIGHYVKILVAGIFITSFFNLIWGGKFILETFLLTLAFVIVQLELFLFIALKLFPRGLEKFTGNYKKNVIIRLLAFYMIILIIGAAFFLLAIAMPLLLGEASWKSVV